MDISVKGRNLDVGDALKGHVEDHLSSAVTKYFMRAIDASVVFSREGRNLRADISVHPGPRGMVVQGGSESNDPYAAFDGALARISKQLRRYKRRLSSHHKGHAEDVLPASNMSSNPSTKTMKSLPTTPRRSSPRCRSISRHFRFRKRSCGWIWPMPR